MSYGVSSDAMDSSNVDTLKKKPIDVNSYKIGCKIGSGSFGFSSLWLAQCVDDPQHEIFVLKKLDADQLSMDDLKKIQYEIHTSSHFNHPCLLAFYCSFVTNGFIWTVFPLFNFGSCRDVIATDFHHGLPLTLVAFVLRSVILALEYLHKMRYIHRGVNASHILLNSDNKVCLAGLRHCIAIPLERSVIHDFPDDTVQLLPWIAPEILMQNISGYNDRSDIYSLGITAVELVTGTIPYSKLRPTEILLQKIRGVVPQLPDKSTLQELHCDLSASQSSLDGLEQTNDMSFSPQFLSAPSKKIKNLQQFVDVCLQADPNLRPSAYQLRHSSYIRSVKRRMKEKDGYVLTELLQPLNAITEIIPDKTLKDSMSEEELVEKVPNVCLDDNDRWCF